jgi:hypothetical protein
MGSLDPKCRPKGTAFCARWGLRAPQRDSSSRRQRPRREPAPAQGRRRRQMAARLASRRYRLQRRPGPRRIWSLQEVTNDSACRLVRPITSTGCYRAHHGTGWRTIKIGCEMPTRSVESNIVVAVDGSPASEGAAALAFDEASRRRVELVALHAWSDVGIDLMLDADWHQTPRRGPRVAGRTPCRVAEAVSRRVRPAADRLRRTSVLARGGISTRPIGGG